MVAGLMSLTLYSNQLSGSIPVELGNLTSLRRLGLSSTYATPVLEIETNARPSGTQTDPAIIPGVGNSNGDWTWNGACHTPQSGQARVHALRNRICGETYKTWTVTHDP